MCGRLACLLNPEELKGACCYLNDQQVWCCPDWIKNSVYTYRPFYNGPPTTTVAALVDNLHCSHVSAEYALIPMHWGLIPSWKEAYDSSITSFNARLENLTNSNLFKPEVVAGHKCIILADGFYEWSSKVVKNKQPHFIYQKPNADDDVANQWNEITGWNGKYVMKLAGVFNSTKLSSGEVRYSCSVITTDSDKSMSWLHHRMPVTINSNKDIRRWLAKSSLSDTIQYLQNNCIEQKDEKFSFQFKTVSSYVNNVRNNDSRCLEEQSISKTRTLLDYYKPKPTSK